MIWKIVQFVIWLIVSFLLSYLFLKSSERILDKLKNKVAIWLSLMLTNSIYGFLLTIFTIGVLALKFLFEFYLMLFLMYLTGITFLAIMLWKMDVLNEKGLSRLINKEKCLSAILKEKEEKKEKEKKKEKYSILIKILNWAFIITSFASLFIIAIIFFMTDISSETMARYIIAVIYLLSSFVIIIGQLLPKIPLMYSKEIDTTLRKDYLTNSFFYYYLLSFFIYIFLWSFDIPLNLPIFTIGAFKIRLLLIIILGIFTFFIFSIVIPYSLGEYRVNKKEIFYLNKRLEWIKEIEKTVDLTDIKSSKPRLNAKNKKILKECASINKEISKKQRTYKKFGFTSQEITECLEDFFKPRILYRDDLMRYSEYITYTLKYETPSGYKELDDRTDKWMGFVKEKLKMVKSRRPLFISVATIIWVLLSTYLGVTLTDILETLL